MTLSGKVIGEIFSVPEYLLLEKAAESESSENWNPVGTLSCKMNSNFINLSLFLAHYVQ